MASFRSSGYVLPPLPAHASSTLASPRSPPPLHAPTSSSSSGGGGGGGGGGDRGSSASASASVSRLAASTALVSPRRTSPAALSEARDRAALPPPPTVTMASRLSAGPLPGSYASPPQALRGGKGGARRQREPLVPLPPASPPLALRRTNTAAAAAAVATVGIHYSPSPAGAALLCAVSSLCASPPLVAAAAAAASTASWRTASVASLPWQPQLDGSSSSVLAATAATTTTSGAAAIADAATRRSAAAAAAADADADAATAYVAEYKRLRKLAAAALAVQCWWRGAPFRESLQTCRIIRMVELRHSWRAWRAVYTAARKYRRALLLRVWGAWKFASDHKRDLQRMAQLLARRHLCGIRLTPHGSARLTVRVFMNQRVTVVARANDDDRAARGTPPLSPRSPTASVDAGTALLAAAAAAAVAARTLKAEADADDTSSDDGSTSAVAAAARKRRGGATHSHHGPPALQLVPGFIAVLSGRHSSSVGHSIAAAVRSVGGGGTPGGGGGDGGGGGGGGGGRQRELTHFSSSMLATERTLAQMSDMLSQMARESLRGSSSMLRSRLLHLSTKSDLPYMKDVEGSGDGGSPRRRGSSVVLEDDTSSANGAAAAAAAVSAWAAFGSGRSSRGPAELSHAAALQHIEGGGQHMLVAWVEYQLKRQWFDAFHEALVVKRRVTHELCARLRGALSSSLREQLAQEWPQQRMALAFVMWQRWVAYKRSRRAGKAQLYFEGVRLPAWDAFVAAVERDAARTAFVGALVDRNLKYAALRSFRMEQRSSRRRRRLLADTLAQWALLPLRMAFDAYRRHARGMALRRERLAGAVKRWLHWQRYEVAERQRTRAVRRTQRRNAMALAWAALRDRFAASAPQRARAAKRLSLTMPGESSAFGGRASRATIMRLRSTVMQAAFQLHSANNSSAATLATMIACWRGWRLFALRRRAWQRLQAAYAREAYTHLLTTVFAAWRSNTKFTASKAAAAAAAAAALAAAAAAAAASAAVIGINDDDGGSEAAAGAAGGVPLVPAASPLAVVVAAAHHRRASAAAARATTFVPTDLIPDVNIAHLMAQAQGTGEMDSTAFTTALLAPREHRSLLDDVGKPGGAASSVARTAAMLLRARMEGRGWTAVHAAAEMCDFRKLHRMLAAGTTDDSGAVVTVDISARDLHGSTPLHIVAAKVSLQVIPIVVLLLMAGAQPLARDDRGRTTLDVCTNPVTRTVLAAHCARLQAGKLEHTERTLLLRWRASYCNLLNTRWLLSSLCPALLHATAVMAEAQAIMEAEAARQRELEAAEAAAAAASDSLDGDARASVASLDGGGSLTDASVELSDTIRRAEASVERIAAAGATIRTSLARALHESVDLRLADMSVQRAFGGVGAPPELADTLSAPRSGEAAPQAAALAAPAAAAAPAAGGGDDGASKARTGSESEAAGGAATARPPQPLRVRRGSGAAPAAGTDDTTVPATDFSSMLRASPRRTSLLRRTSAEGAADTRRAAGGPSAEAVASGRGTLTAFESAAPSAEAAAAAAAGDALEARVATTVRGPAAVIDVARMPTEMHHFCIRNSRASVAAIIANLDATASVAHHGDRLLRTLETLATRGDTERAARLEALANQVPSNALPSEAAIRTLAAQVNVDAELACVHTPPQAIVAGTDAAVVDEMRWMRRVIATTDAEIATTTRQIDMFRAVALDAIDSIDDAPPASPSASPTARRAGGGSKRGGGGGGGGDGGGSGGGSNGSSILAASAAFVDLRRKLAALVQAKSDFTEQLSEAEGRLLAARRLRDYY